MSEITRTGRKRRPPRNPAKLVLGLWAGLFVVFLLLPMVVVVAVSFSSASFVSFPIPGFSLRWYARAFDYAPFMSSLLTSIELAVAATLVGTLLGIPAAIAVARSRHPVANAMSNFLLTPLSMPEIVLGFALLYFLASLRIGSGFLSLLIAHSIVAIPYISRTVMSVYRAIPASHEEAGAVLGASRFQILRQIILPQIMPGVFAGGMFSMLISFDNVSLSYFFGSAHTSTLPVVMLSYMENQFDPSIAAISTIQMLIAIVTLFAIHRAYGIQRLTSM
ncbi:ABC transporter permease [Paroceanicella profunda]|uniref:ABC transporter permease n=1 Tax=Paroceanicella profunda TaxID=2579971 RepID=A0A5B8G2F6_9RHOB|nr:ABC transporter permease [Paroceanicella profunda]QDL93332.1 ABC transporter permease [Paroceanicella profunda]